MQNPAQVFKQLAKKHPTPQKVQNFLRTLNYNREEDGKTARSAFEALRVKKVHCLESCLVAAAILEQSGYPPLFLSLDSSDNVNHVVFIFKAKTGWGSVARSREPGLHGREPRFRSLRDLAWSYFDPFIDKTGSLIGYAPGNFDDSETDWRFSPRNLWKLDNYTVTLPFKKIRSRRRARNRALFESYLENGPIQSGKFWW